MADPGGGHGRGSENGDGPEGGPGHGRGHRAEHGHGPEGHAPGAGHFAHDDRMRVQGYFGGSFADRGCPPGLAK
jgi:hypothetical protein